MRGTAATLTLVLGLLPAVGCTCGSRDAQPASGPAPAAPSASVAPRELAPLAAESWRIDLPVVDFEPASVAVPLGAREPRPVVIALHGIADRADWQCGTWTGISKARAFVLCPRGIKRGNVETFGDFARTEKELRAALHALKSRFGAHVSSGPVVHAGYSLGAMHAVMIAKQEPSFFARLVLVEGGHDRVSATIAGVLAKGGAKRVLFACGQKDCERQSKHRMVYLRRAGVEAELVSAPGVGHALESRMAAAIESRWAWLTEGDQRFAKGMPR